MHVTRAGLRGAPALMALAGALSCGDSSAPAPSLPSAIAVAVGNNYFESSRNGGRNPAVDTVAIDGVVTWTWVEGGEHNIGSFGNPTFPASEPLDASGSTYRVTFPAAGTYAYECGIHGSPMAGLVVVR